MKKKTTTRWTPLHLAIPILLLGLSFHSKAQIGDTITISPVVGNVIDSSEKVRSHIFPYYSPKIFIRAVFLRNVDSTITLKAQLKPDSLAEKLITKKEYDWIKSMIETQNIPPRQNRYEAEDFFFIFQLFGALFSGYNW